MIEERSELTQQKFSVDQSSLKSAIARNVVERESTFYSLFLALAHISRNKIKKHTLEGGRGGRGESEMRAWKEKNKY